ncbi:hypothetical protein [Paludibacterium denitrificans]|uniref:Uncharacterized protein n=1 Tax=Paludibacterium denitrificans TaxID=2675226 RepID=A0A844GCG9_9NEIS|nr:hypothetical protein [Paludibacterium denitrificans]MTD33442.1 hypothetical protein [Paludibacterium denitrificans]
MDSWLDSVLAVGEESPVCSPLSGNRAEGEQKVGTAESLMQQGFQDFVPTVPTVPTKKQSPRKSEENTPKAGETFTPVGDLTAGVVTALATGQATPAPTLPADLLERTNLICQRERWPEADRVEWLDILRRQIDRDHVPVPELVATLDAHLARHHTPPDPEHDREAFEERAAILEYDGGLPRAEAERLAGQVHPRSPAVAKMHNHDYHSIPLKLKL